ncbi:RNA (C5-cytosine) methyltransferase [Kipferlia bialata]|uniref:RNA (C5-cytosine) methyltransferase n=1 Tax=Kipferlia bialata TaxID=797122 RepID=A0A9K3GI51_9EUKA|nr:RNA (C5-cytosine) methyltransferase [Kipferlia bialata]|eukprot:g6335.t1
MGGAAPKKPMKGGKNAKKGGAKGAAKGKGKGGKGKNTCDFEACALVIEKFLDRKGGVKPLVYGSDGNVPFLMALTLHTLVYWPYLMESPVFDMLEPAEPEAQTAEADGEEMEVVPKARDTAAMRKHLCMAAVLAVSLLRTGELPHKRRRLGQSTRHVVATLRPVAEPLLSALQSITLTEDETALITPPTLPVTVRCTQGRQTAVEALEKAGWKAVSYPPKQRMQFCPDPVLEGVLALAANTPWGKKMDGCPPPSAGLVAQSRGSCIPALALGLTKEDTVWDMCAAPGSKTIHAAAMAKKVIASERDSTRAAMLLKRVLTSNCANVDVREGDALTLSPPCTCVILDPSCSSSGTKAKGQRDATLGARAAWPRSYGRDRDITSHKEVDVTALAAAQTQLLHHALTALPKCTRVVYSTCSVNHAENEAVVQGVLTQEGVRGVWEVANVLPAWPQRGESAGWADAAKCIRAGPRTHSEGFFVSMLVRK